MNRIGIIGCGYVGLVTGVCLAELGNEVTCADIDEKKIESLLTGMSPIYEPDLQPLLERNLSQQRVRFTSDIDQVIRDTDILFVAVGTPTTVIGTADLSQVNSVLDRIISVATGEKIVVMKSTVPVGTGARFCQLFHCSNLSHISYISNPEFLREGQAVRDFMMPDRIVIGGEDANSVGKVANLYQGFDVPFVFTSTVNAELIKYASNAFLATKISFINEIANLCEEVDADVTVVAEGMGLDPRINPYFLKAGIGYGGSCFPKDVRALKQIAGSNGYHFELLSAVIEVNEMQKYRVIRKLQQYFGYLEGKRIAVFGLSFKPKTDDTRNSVAVELLEILLSEGVNVVATDPLAIEQVKKKLPAVTYVEAPYKAAEGVEAIVVATEDPLYVNLDWNQISNLMANNLVVDGRNILSPEKLPQNIVLEQIGRRNKPRTASDYSFGFDKLGKVA